MSHPNTKPFLANVTTKENKTNKVMQAGGNPKNILGGAKPAANPSSKKKTL